MPFSFYNSIIMENQTIMKRILVIPTDKGGTSKFRTNDPHIKLNEMYPDEYHVDVEYNFDPNNVNLIKRYDIIVFQKLAIQPDQSVNIINHIKNQGVKVIVDTDDYWQIDKTHYLYSAFQKNNIAKHMVDTYAAADLVTCSTQALYDKILKYNKNVFVIPNAIDKDESQFKANKTKSDRLRIGYIGGSSHLKDIELIKSIGELLYNEYKDKLQFVLCGFDLRGVTNIVNEKTGEVTQRPIRPEESVWTAYERYITNDYKIVKDDEQYIKQLLLFNPGLKIDDLDKSYRRVWTRDINNYANGYNEIDVMLAPIATNEFNLYKSNLKVIEAGFHKVPIIASNYGPYTTDIDSGYIGNGQYKDSGNGFLVDPTKNNKDWVRFIKYFLNNRDKADEYGENLYNTVKDKYELSNVTQTRKQIYDQFLSLS